MSASKDLEHYQENRGTAVSRHYSNQNEYNDAFIIQK